MINSLLPLYHLPLRLPLLNLPPLLPRRILLRTPLCIRTTLSARRRICHSCCMSVFPSQANFRHVGDVYGKSVERENER